MGDGDEGERTVRAVLASTQLDVERQKLTANRATTSFDVQGLEKEVAKARLDLEQLEANYADARIVAAFDGKITKVNGKSGDNVQAFNPVIPLLTAALHRSAEDGITDPHQLQQVVRRTVGRWVNDAYRRRPMIVPTVVEV